MVEDQERQIEVRIWTYIFFSIHLMDQFNLSNKFQINKMFEISSVYLNTCIPYKARILQVLYLNVTMLMLSSVSFRSVTLNCKNALSKWFHMYFTYKFH
jgi:hypothetical protein